MFKPEYVKSILFSDKEIVKQIKKAGKWATKRFKDVKEPIVAVCILKGACQFFSHVVENIEHEMEFDFTTLKSYRGTQSVGQPEIIKNLSTSVENKDVLVIEDVCDTAKTLPLLIDHLKTQKPRSITVMVLVDKIDCRLKPFKPDYACFTILNNPFIIGYGLDYEEIGRNLPYIGEFDKNFCH